MKMAATILCQEVKKVWGVSVFTQVYPGGTMFTQVWALSMEVIPYFLLD